jgi:DNA-binding GntR family transcriptional regulator
MIASELSNYQLLRIQVYENLREKLRNGILKPGMFISINQMVQNLGISRTPLRDALLQLQTEGFVTFLPQRGIRIVELSLRDVENIFDIISALDSRVLISIFNKIGPKEIDKMKKINEKMLLAGSKNELFKYWELNTKFHGTYLNLSKNDLILHHISILRQQLFGFRKMNWWDKLTETNYEDHLKIIDMIEEGDAKKVAEYLRDVHLSYQDFKDIIKPQPEQTGSNQEKN